MKNEEIMVDGKKIDVVVELSSEEKEDMILIDELEETLDLGNVLEVTKKIDVGVFNE